MESYHYPSSANGESEAAAVKMICLMLPSKPVKKNLLPSHPEHGLSFPKADDPTARDRAHRW